MSTQRITKGDLQAALAHLCDSSAGMYHVAQYHGDINGLFLERIYGTPNMWRVMRYIESKYWDGIAYRTGIGETYAWRSTLMTASALRDMLYHMADALRQAHEYHVNLYGIYEPQSL